MYKYFFSLLLTCFILTGCSKAIIPQTGNQLQTVSYSQIYSLATEANTAFEENLIDAETHADIHSKLSTAMKAIGSEGGTDKVAEILNKVREKL